jgi:hypothetical protein
MKTEPVTKGGGRSMAALAASGWAAAGFATGVLIVHMGYVQASAPAVAVDARAQAPAAAQPAAVRVFASDAGMVLNFIKPDRTEDFEAIVGKLRTALQTSGKTERRSQAASWKVFRATEPGANDSVLYVFAIDPAVKGADYTVSTILAEAFPTEVQTLFKQYADSYASGQNFVNLTLVSALGQ